MLNVQVLDKHEDNVDGWICEPGEELSSINNWLFNEDFHSAYGLDSSEPDKIEVTRDYEGTYSVSYDGRIIYGVYFDEK